MKHMYINKQQEHKTIIFITQLLVYIDRERNFQSVFPGHFPHFKIPYQKITIYIYIYIHLRGNTQFIYPRDKENVLAA